MTLLTVRNLSLVLNEKQRLKDVSFDIKPRSTTTIVGASGSGKSLTALALMQLLPQGAKANGALIFDHIDMMHAPEKHLNTLRGNTISMIFQEPMSALNPVMSIEDQIMEPIVIHGSHNQHHTTQHARDLCERVGLASHICTKQHYPHQLSGGQRQRVMIAMALARKPKLLIADEPTTALDVVTQDLILTQLQDLTQEFGTSLLLITHDLAIAQRMSDQIIVLHSGATVETGPAQDLLSAPKHEQTQRLIAAHHYQPKRTKSTEQTRTKAALVDTHKLCFSYPQKRIWGQKHPQHNTLNNVNLTLKSGDRLGIVGESGCGKSTLARVLLGLHPPTSGTLNLSKNSPHQHIQAVFQDPHRSFNPRHKVLRLLKEPFHKHPNAPTSSKQNELAKQALQNVGLCVNDLNRYIHEFSGGQRQRIAIARALITKPDLIIFDEAISALDTDTRGQILDLLLDIHANHAQSQTPLSYIFITHDISLLEHITDHIAVMKSGEIVEHAPTKTLLKSPQHEQTKALFSAVPKLL